jgi:hypothetical protein
MSVETRREVVRTLEKAKEERRKLSGTTEREMEWVATEVKLLRQPSRVTRDQAAIAFERKALSGLTNIVVARLGAAGAGFQ